MITTVVFDYGRVLAYPTAGNWFITKNTHKILGLANFIRCLIKRKKIGISLHQAHNYLNSNHLLHTEEEEYLQFIEFYKIFFHSMNFKKDMTSICKKLAHDIVYNDDKVDFYDDVISSFTVLKKSYNIVVLSDTWPSLKRILSNKGILSIIDGLIMSCDYGETKESTKLFEIAALELSLTANECIFIDNSLSNLKNAEKVGYHPVSGDRNNKVASSKYPIVKNMNDVIAMVSEVEIIFQDI